MIGRVLQVCVTLMAILASAALTLGQGAYLLAAAAVLAAAVAYYLTDVRDEVHLGRPAANVVALLAVAFSLFRFQADRGLDQLLAIANLLVYLQMVLLFQRKNGRVYWQLMMLSLLQIVVATALSGAITFGFLLIVYTAVSLVALCAFFVYRETSRFPAATRRDRSAASEDSTRGTGVIQLDGPRRSAAEGSEPHDQVLVRGAMRQIPAMGLATVIVSVVVFYLLPRLGESALSTPSTPLRSVGFSDEIDLLPQTEILTSDEQVMRISLTEQATGESYPLGEGPYIRGGILTDYRGGRWIPSRGLGMARGSAVSISPPGRDIVRQEVVLWAEKKERLFVVYPPYYAPATTDEVRYDPGEAKFFLSGEQAPARGPLRYSLTTTAFAGGRQLEITPPEQGHRPQLDRLLRLPAARVQQLSELAAQIVIDGGHDMNDRIGRAKDLEAHFHSSGEYVYTLDRNVPQNGDVDPLEAFVSNPQMRRGHCEYFAGALALMLRSQGIPARIVVGYKTEEYNAVGDYYVVRDRHAHAWVEAYLEPEHIPPGQMHNAESAARGGWLRLDPTPMGEAALLDRSQTGFFNALRQFFSHLRNLWAEYVFGLDAQRQREMIYEPIVEFFGTIFSADAWRERLVRLGTWLGLTADSEVRWPLSLLRHLLLGFLLVGLGIFVLRRLPFRLPSNPWASLRSLFAAPPSRPQKRHNVDFYRRLEAALRKLGVERTDTKTHGQFAREAAAALRQRPALQVFSALPGEVVGAFLALRFAGRQPSTQQQAEFHRRTTALEDAINSAAR